MKTNRMRVTAVATTCALVGAGAGIAGSTAATSKSKSGSSAKTTKQRGAGTGTQAPGRYPGGPGGSGRPGFGRHGGPAVHVEAVVLNKAGTAYITQTVDEGLVKSVSGDELTITEGTKAVPYKDVTVTIPSGATIMRNGKTAQLSDLKADDHVHVVSSSDGTVVFAADDSFRPPMGRGRGDHDRGRDHHGPPPAGAPAPPVAP